MSVEFPKYNTYMFGELDRYGLPLSHIYANDESAITTYATRPVVVHIGGRTWYHGEEFTDMREIRR